MANITLSNPEPLVEEQPGKKPALPSQGEEGINWITERFNCSLDRALNRLTKQVLGDLEDWETQRPPNDAVAKVNTGLNRILISRSSYLELGPWVSFELMDNSIWIRYAIGRNISESEVETTRLVPVLNRDGQCRLQKLSDTEPEELQFWQASRLILERVLFC